MNLAGDYDGVLISHPPHIAYLRGIEFPFAESFPDRLVILAEAGGGPGLIVCPFEWKEAVIEQGWSGDIISYDDDHADPVDPVLEAVAGAIKSAGAEKGRIGIEEERLSLESYEALRRAIPAAELAGIDEDLHTALKTKRPQEVELLRKAAAQLETGIIGAVQHLEGSLGEVEYTAAEFCERIRVHVYEAGGTASGLSAAAAGESATALYTLPRGSFREGELMRIEASSRYRGYWAVSSRMFSLGCASALQRRAYEENLLLKRALVELLKPGKNCGDIYSEIAALSRRKGIDLVPSAALGCGIGVHEREAPYIDGRDRSELEAGMCISATVYTFGPGRELVCTKDSYLISDEGSQCLSCYHNWDRLYEIRGFRSAH